MSPRLFAYLALVVVLCFGNTAADNCPTLIRVINTYNPDSPTSINVLVNGQVLIKDTPFCGASSYVSFFPPEEDIVVSFTDAKSGTKFAERKFMAQAGYAYTLGLTGPIPGPEGQQLFNSSPFVVPDDLSIPNPDRFRGRWYRWSETNVTIDFRLFRPDTPDIDAARLRKKAPKIAIEYPEMPIGEYSFTPVLMDSNDVLINSNYNPAEPVGIFNKTINDEVIFDVWACGNSLLASNKPNTLRNYARAYKPKYEGSCLLVDDLSISGSVDFATKTSGASAFHCLVFGLINIVAVLLL